MAKRTPLSRRVFPARVNALPQTIQRLVSHKNPDPSQAAEGFVAGMDAVTVEVEDEHDAFLLDPGMGPLMFLTADGRVLRDGRTWDGETLREATDDEAISALVVGAKKTGIAGLLELIPSCPSEGSQCANCQGRRMAELVPGAGFEVICTRCSGRGWYTAERSRGP